jgi:hypothetical protein
MTRTFIILLLFMTVNLMERGLCGALAEVRPGPGAFEMQMLGDGDPHVRLVAKVLVIGAL